MVSIDIIDTPHTVHFVMLLPLWTEPIICLCTNKEAFYESSNYSPPYAADDKNDSENDKEKTKYD